MATITVHLVILEDGDPIIDHTYHAPHVVVMEQPADGHHPGPIHIEAETLIMIAVNPKETHIGALHDNRRI